MAGNLTAMIAAAFSGGAAPPVTTDPYYEYTTLLLPGNGTNGAQNNTFLDGSTNNFTITRNGNTTQGTFSPFSQTGWGNYFVANNANVLTAATGSGVAFGTGDFCQEFFLYANSYAGVWRIISYVSAAGTAGMSSQLPDVNLLTIGTGAGTFNTGIALPTKIWFHLVYTRQSGRIRIFVDGVLQYNVADTTNYTTSQSVYIGGYSGFSQSWDGYISNARIIKGSVPAAYQTSSTTNGTTIFTPPTSPLTAVTGTELLTCQSNRFFDSNTQVTAKTITVTGSPTVVAFSPFNPSASWSAATYGGSGYFDGSGDYLEQTSATQALNLSSGDWSIGFWVYKTSSSNGSIINLYNSAGSTPGFSVWIGSSGVKVDNGISGGIQAGTVNLNAWSYIEIIRSSGTTTLYVNGSSVGTTTQTPNASQYGRFGTAADGSLPYQGYIADLRIVKGTALTPSVPTAPLTAITNTSLLLNFTNAGIYDATSKNDLETVGNAQISTTQSKWGGSSIAFDGTGDGLIAPKNVLYEIGSGDWTWETWAYSSSYSATQIFTSYEGTSGSGYALFSYAVYCSGGKVGIDISNGSTSVLNVTSVNNVPTNSWVHLAITRSNGTFRVFINGSLDNTSSVYSGTPYVPSTAVLSVGFGPTRFPFTGYIQDFRVTKGYARYTANFTPPTAAFPTL